MTETTEDRARELAGNWKRFTSFSWYDRPDDGENWAIAYTHNRDSGLLDQSNAAAIEKILEPLTDGDDPDVVAEHHGHWACGWVDGYSIRVYRGGEITPAFRAYAEILDRIENYPILDEEDYSAREYEATCENIKSAGERFARSHDYTLPEGDDWVGDMYSWFSDNDQSAIENRDDQGGYPDDDELREAFDALGYHCAEHDPPNLESK